MSLRGVNNGSRETVNAAAQAIVQAENRARQIDEPQRRRKPKFLPCFFPCFSPSENRRSKPNPSALAPLPSPTRPVSSQPDPLHARPHSSSSQPIPPPSSPASSLSLLQSEPNSLTHSPSNFSFGPYSFGPYSNELTQLVSPPVFSTEPSTAPFTPPPESVQLILTSPNSPEVPFATVWTHFDPQFGGNSQVSPNSVGFDPQFGGNSRVSPNSVGFDPRFGGNSQVSPNSVGFDPRFGGNSQVSPNSVGFDPPFGGNNQVSPNWVGFDPHGSQISPNSVRSSDSNSSPYRQGLNSWNNLNNVNFGGNQISPNSVGSSNSNSSPCGKGLNNLNNVNNMINFPMRESPKLIGIEEISARKSMPFHARKEGSLLDGQISARETERRVSFEIDSDEIERKEGERNGDTKEKLEGDNVERSEPSVFKFENSEGNSEGRNGTSEVTKSWPFFPLESRVS